MNRSLAQGGAEMADIYEQMMITCRQIAASFPVPRFYDACSKELSRSRRMMAGNRMVACCMEEVADDLRDNLGHGLDHARKVALEAGALAFIECGRIGLGYARMKRVGVLAQIAGLLHDVRRGEEDHARRSADAAATLLGLERLTRDRLGPAVRFELAAQLGSDVPLFLWGGRVLGCGRGEEVYPLPDLPSRPCLLVYPGFAVSTAEAYRQASLRLTGRKPELTIKKLGAWPQFSRMEWRPAENDFEEVVFARWPELARLKASLIRAGAEAASLTGSGSAVYAIFDSALKLSAALRVVPRDWKVFPTRTLSRAEYRRLQIVR